MSVGKSTLDVSILGDILDTFLKNVKTVGGDTHDDFDNFVFLGGSVNHSSVPLKEKSDCLDNCNAERSEGNSSHMVSESPIEGGSNSSTSLGISVHGEVPDARGSSNNKLTHSVDESSNPEKAEDLVPENVSGSVAPFNMGKETPWVFTSFWLSDRENVNSAENPYESPNDLEDPSEEWKKEDSQVSAHILSSSFVNSHCNLDSSPAAADAAEENSTKSPKSISTILNPSVVGVLLWHAESIVSSKVSSNNK